MQFEVKELNNFCGMLQMPVPRECSEQLNKLANAIKDGKTLTVKIDIKREKRSLNANALMWKALQDLAVHYQTSRWELYKKYIVEYGEFEYLAVLKDALPNLSSIFRVVLDKGTVKTAEGVELVRVQCFWGSSQYDTKAFSRLLDQILQDAKAIGFDYVSEEEKQSLIDAYDRERKDNVKEI